MYFTRMKKYAILLSLVLLSSCLPVKVPPQNYTNIQNAIKKSKFYPSVRSTFSPKGQLNINIRGNVEMAVTLKASDAIFEGYDLGWCGKQTFKVPAISNQYSDSIQKIDCKNNSEKLRISQSLNLRLAKLIRNIKLLGANGMIKESNDIYIWVYLPIVEIIEKYLVDYEDPNHVIATPLDNAEYKLTISKTDIPVIGKVKEDRVPQAIIMIPKAFHARADIDWKTISSEKIIAQFKQVNRIKQGRKEQYTLPRAPEKNYLNNVFLMTIK